MSNNKKIRSMQDELKNVSIKAFCLQDKKIPKYRWKISKFKFLVKANWMWFSGFLKFYTMVDYVLKDWKNTASYSHFY